MLLLRDGVMQLRWGKGRTKPVSIETYQERLRTDMRCVRRIAEHGGGHAEPGRCGAHCQPVHTLVIHGDSDETIPQTDSFLLHHHMTTGSAYDVAQGVSSMQEAARNSICILQDDAKATASAVDARSDEHPMKLTPESFSPPLSATLPHAFVPLAGGDHLFTRDLPLQRILLQTVCLWINEHAATCSRVQPTEAGVISGSAEAMASSPSVAVEKSAPLSASAAKL